MYSNLIYRVPVRRAWNGFVAEGDLRDRFANAVAHRISDENHEAALHSYAPALVDDFVATCDALFAAHEPATVEAVEALAATIDTTGLFELTGDEE